jgi:predicted ATPase
VDLLDDNERSLLETMAIFVDGWAVDAAGQVAGLAEDRALDLSEALTRSSLIQLDSTGRGPRLRMLNIIRRFVAERLAERPDVAEIGRRHADYYRAVAERADRLLRGLGQDHSAEGLETEAANLAAAVGSYMTHDRRPLPHLFRVIWMFWGLRDHLGEARSWIDQLLPTADPLEPTPRPSCCGRRRSLPWSWWARTRRRWQPASASNRCWQGSATPTRMWCPSWPWRGS